MLVCPDWKCQPWGGDWVRSMMPPSLRHQADWRASRDCTLRTVPNTQSAPSRGKRYDACPTMGRLVCRRACSMDPQSRNAQMGGRASGNRRLRSWTQVYRPVFFFVLGFGESRFFYEKQLFFGTWRKNAGWKCWISVFQVLHAYFFGIITLLAPEQRRSLVKLSVQEQSNLNLTACVRSSKTHNLSVLYSTSFRDRQKIFCKYNKHAVGPRNSIFHVSL